MARLKSGFVERVDGFCDRVLHVAEALEQKRRFPRVIDQLAGAGTAVGTNLAEAAEAMRRKDFCKCLGISLEEISECRFLMRLIARRGWVDARRLNELQREAQELTKIIGAMIARTKIRSA